MSSVEQKSDPRIKIMQIPINLGIFSYFLDINLLHCVLISYFSGPTTVLSEGMKNIITAMKENGIECVSVCLSGRWCTL
jgi:hypothetical protein